MSAPLQEGGLLDIQARGQRGGQRRMLRQLRVGVNESEGILARLLDEVLVLEDVEELQLGTATVLGRAEDVALAPLGEVEAGEFEAVRGCRNGPQPLPRW